MASNIVRSNVDEISLSPTTVNTNKNDSSPSRLNWISYGEIQFDPHDCNTAKFIRIKPGDNPIDVKKWILGETCDEKSCLVLSIQGSAKESHLRSKLFRIFRESLLKLAENLNIWIITAGFNLRVTKLFGEIVRTAPSLCRRIHLVGIASWGCLANVNQFNVRDERVIYSYSKAADEDGLLLLEPNHTHFVFVDDGIKHNQSCALKYRMQLEKVLLTEKTFVPKTNYFHIGSIPIVIIVIEGCVDAIRKVSRSVVDCWIPVVFLQGTGGCCDLFSKCSHLYNEYYFKTELSERTNDEVEENMKRKTNIRQRLKIINDELVETSCSNTIPEECMDYFDLIYESVHTREISLNFLDFNLDDLSGNDINSIILQAFLRVSCESDKSCQMKEKQLDLAYRWKQIDIITKWIIINERDWQRIQLKNLFRKSLKENRAEFVEIFLDHDFLLSYLFHNPSQILELYQDDLEKSTLIMKKEFVDHFNEPLRSIYDQTNESIIGNLFQLNAHFHLVHLPNETSKNRRRQLINSNGSSFVRSETNISRELFLWAILTNKKQLSLLFWSRGRNQIAAALIGVLAYQYQARKDRNDHYEERAKEWELLAVKILEKFSEIDSIRCKEAITRPIVEFGRVTWIQLAIMAQSKLFIAKPIVQEILTDIWRGQIKSDVSISRVIFSTLMPWFAAPLLYPKESTEKENQHREYDLCSSQSPSTSNQLRETQVNCPLMDEDCSEKKRNNRYMDKTLMFIRSPRVKYLYHLYSRVLFLLLFSYVILFDCYPLYQFQSDKCLTINSNLTLGRTSKVQMHRIPSMSEIILMFWVLTLFCESIRQIATMKTPSIIRKIEVYLSIFWNQLNVLSLILFVIGCIFRFVPLSGCFCIARMVFCVSLSFWYIRSLEIFCPVKILGPKLVMIQVMIHDLIFFMLIIFVFMFAFGVPAYSLLNDVHKFSWHVPRQIINLAYWQIFGDSSALEDVKKNYDIHGYVVFCLLVAYTIIASVLLINLLIAMFSNTFNELHSDTDNLWKFQRFSLVCDYLSRPLLPPPLIFIEHLWRLIKYLHLKTKPCDSTKENCNELEKEVNPIFARQIEQIEDALGKEIFYFSIINNRKRLCT